MYGFSFSQNKGTANVHTVALALGVAGLLSRLLGVARDRLLAGRFGAGRELDIYYAAFQIPDFISVIFLLGAGSAAILPIFQNYLRDDPKKARDMLGHISTLFVVCAVGLGILAFLFAPFFVRLIAPGFSSSDQGVTLVLIRIMLISPILLGLSSIFSAALQSFERFLAYALAPIFYNIGIIAGTLFFVKWWGLAGLALGVVLGALLHMLVQLVSLKSLNFMPYPVMRGLDANLKKIFMLSLPRVISLSFLQITTLVLVAISSTLAAGTVAIFQFALNLYYVPVGIFGISYSVALFPGMNLAFLDRDAKSFFHELFLGIRSILFWIMPAAALFWVLRVDIVAVALGDRAFSSESVALTAACLGILTIAMIGASTLPHLIKGFYALEYTRTPMIIDIGCGLLSVALAFFFTDALSRHTAIGTAIISFLNVGNSARTEVLGIALGFSLGLFMNCLLLYIALARVSSRMFAKNIVFPAGAILKICGAAAGAGAAAHVLQSLLIDIFRPTSSTWILVQGIAIGLGAMAIYGTLLLFLKSEDVRIFMRT